MGHFCPQEHEAWDKDTATFPPTLSTPEAEEGQPEDVISQDLLPHPQHSVFPAQLFHILASEMESLIHACFANAFAHYNPLTE